MAITGQSMQCVESRDEKCFITTYEGNADRFKRQFYYLKCHG